MSRTIIEQIIIEIVDELIIRKPQNGPVLFSFLKDLRSGKYPQDLVNAIFQKPKQFDIDVYDAYCFLHVWSGLFSGKIARAKIWVGNKPNKDVDIISNNEILSKLIHPFKAEFLPSKSGDDGYFEWIEKLTLQKEDVNNLNNRIQYVNIDPISIPLEVGYTSSFKTYEYMTNQGGVVARFPYNSEDIFIFYNLDYEKDFLERSTSMYRV